MKKCQTYMGPYLEGVLLQEGVVEGFNDEYGY